MNKWLMKSIVDLAAYLTLEAPIPDDMASEYLDIIGPNLEKLTSEERNEFFQYIEKLIITERDSAGNNATYIYFLEHLGQDFGLVEPKKQLYFIWHKPERNPEFRPEEKFEIQVLDSRLRGRLTGHVGIEDSELVLEGHVVPRQVIRATLELAPGQADYVDRKGNHVEPLQQSPPNAGPLASS